MPAWPAALSTPTIAPSSGTTLEPQPAFRRTDMDVGPARQRRVTTAPLVRATYEIELDMMGLGIFEAWYRHELADGALWFDYRAENGAGLWQVLARFVEPWKATRRPRGWWLVSMPLELKGLPTMTPQQLAPYL
jgi:hypothetical protein